MFKSTIQIAKELLQNQQFVSKICQISKGCSGGGSGGAGSLQDVTNIGNTTSNPINIQDLDSGNETALATSVDNFQLVSTINGQQIIFTLQDENNIIATISKNGATSVEFRDIGVDSIAAVFQGTVVGAPAENGDQFVILDQLSNISTPNEVTSDNLVFLNAGTYYTSNSTDPVDYILPTITEGVGKRIGIINMNAGVLTVTPNGSDNIYSNGVMESSIVLNEGETNILYNNSLAWVIIA